MKFDVVVIGGGVNGTGIARDLALRGVKTALLEKRDISAGATGACSGMIHGGARYLLYDVPTTKLACLDSGYIQKIAPHLLFRIPFILPILKGNPLGGFMTDLVETYFEIYDRYVHLKNGRPHTRLTREEALRLDPRLTPGILGAVTMDEWGIDTFRLCLENAVSARENGAAIFNHTEAVDLAIEDGRARGVRIRVHLPEKREDFIEAKIVFVAVGPWTPAFLKKSGIDLKIRPGKGVHLIFDRRLSDTAVIFDTIDGRSVFVMPHESTSILGTTDDDFYGGPDNLTAPRDEIEYLLQAAERVLPAIRRARIIRTMCGVRPTVYEWGKVEDKLSREHAIHDHGRRDGVEGLFTMVGGKLASYRIMAEEAADAICEKLGHEAPCRTHEVPLPGGEAEFDPAELAREHGVPLYAARRLVYRHGTRAQRVLDLTRNDPSLKEPVCSCEPVLAAEVVYACREEMALKLSDVRRRTRLGAGPCQGMNCTFKAADLLARERGLTAEETLGEIYDFMRNRWKGVRPIVDGVQAAQEELSLGRALVSGGLAFHLRPEGVFEQWRR